MLKIILEWKQIQGVLHIDGNRFCKANRLPVSVQVSHALEISNVKKNARCNNSPRTNDNEIQWIRKDVCQQENKNSKGFFEHK